MSTWATYERADAEQPAATSTVPECQTLVEFVTEILSPIVTRRYGHAHAGAPNGGDIVKSSTASNLCGARGRQRGSMAAQLCPSGGSDTSTATSQWSSQKTAPSAAAHPNNTST